MERRVLFAAVLSAVFLAWYSNVIARWGNVPGRERLPVADQRQIQPPGIAAQRASPDEIDIPHLEHEEVTFIESKDLKLEIGKKSGTIRRAILKQFTDSSGSGLLQFGGGVPLLSVRVGEPPVSFRLLAEQPESVIFEETDNKENTYRLSYVLAPPGSLIDIKLQLEHAANIQETTNVTLINSWSKSDGLSKQYNMLEVFVATESDGRSNAYKHKKSVAPFRSEKIVPRGTPLVSLAERYFCQLLKPGGGAVEIRLIQSSGISIAAATIASVMTSKEKPTQYSATVYMGPRDYFYLKKLNLEAAFPIGMIGQIGLIFLMFLSWVGKATHNYGIAIILFSGLITLVMSPMTLISLRSMKKMQELKPKLDKIMAQHKEDKTKANQEIFALYRAHKVSPLSGCLPMLLQLPVFIALFQAMSHFIELRGKRFLWISDLSLPDRLAQLPISLPLIGQDFNLLPVIMSVAMYLQTKLSQQPSSAAEQNPTARMMSGPWMSIVFCFMFYNFPSGLVLYWLTNSLTSIALYRLVK
ncbi:MAG: membrane protein insertase YidC [Candidatus Omnitrophica bacterium]|nr:membrane protein insertase YidC [Candidatus Omnitrophota bacterium]